jgi:predicted RNA-binding Zn-ribbon protein involved in translation (DUF1610 family)
MRAVIGDEVTNGDHEHTWTQISGGCMRCTKCGKVLDVEHELKRLQCPKCDSLPDTGPRIVCLCGSTRFYEAFQEANFKLTMDGKIVLSVGFYPHAADKAHAAHAGVTPEQKEHLDDLHFRKIEMAHSVHILNVGGYIGASTARELAYSISIGKSVSFLEPENGEALQEDRAHELGAMVAAFVRGAKPDLSKWPETPWSKS